MKKVYVLKGMEHTLDQFKSMEMQGKLPKNYTAMVISNLFFQPTGNETIYIFK